MAPGAHATTPVTYLHSRRAGQQPPTAAAACPPFHPGDEPADTYVYNPDDPAPTLGGNTLVIPPSGWRTRGRWKTGGMYWSIRRTRWSATWRLPGPSRCGCSPPAAHPTPTSTAKLVDVRPDGYAQNLQDGIIRARSRTSVAQPSFIQPGQVHEYAIDLWATSHVVKAGHRLRVDVSSSNFPRFDRNPNTGAPPGTGLPPGGRHAKRCTTQRNTRHTFSLPVIPR